MLPRMSVPGPGTGQALLPDCGGTLRALGIHSLRAGQVMAVTQVSVLTGTGGGCDRDAGAALLTAEQLPCCQLLPCGNLASI